MGVMVGVESVSSGLANLEYFASTYRVIGVFDEPVSPDGVKEMTTNHDENLILRWGNNTQTILQDCSALFRSFSEDTTPLSKPVANAVGELAKKCTLTSDSAILLITAGKMWDAEMLCRSVLEGTCRLA